MIVVIYRSSDGVRFVKRYATIEPARKFAHHYVGAHPDIGSTYAVSHDGIGTIYVEGCTLAQLFPPREKGDANRE